MRPLREEPLGSGWLPSQSCEVAPLERTLGFGMTRGHSREGSARPSARPQPCPRGAARETPTGPVPPRRGRRGASDATPGPQARLTPGVFALGFLRVRGPGAQTESGRAAGGSSTYPCSRPCRLFLGPSPLRGPPRPNRGQKSGCALRVFKHMTRVTGARAARQQHGVGRSVCKHGGRDGSPHSDTLTLKSRTASPRPRRPHPGRPLHGQRARGRRLVRDREPPTAGRRLSPPGHRNGSRLHYARGRKAGLGLGLRPSQIPSCPARVPTPGGRG